MNGILQSINEKVYEFNFGRSFAQFDRSEVSEIAGLVSKAGELQTELEPLIEELQENAGEIDKEAERAEWRIKSAMKLAELNNLPEHFQAAFAQVLGEALDSLRYIRKDYDCSKLGTKMAAALFEYGIE